MAEVGRTLLQGGIGTPLASNVAVTSFADIPESVKKDAVQVILCDPHYWGGLRQVQHPGKIFRTFNLGLSLHFNTHLRVSLLAMAPVAAATPPFTYSCGTPFPLQSGKNEIVAGGRVQIFC